MSGARSYHAGLAAEETVLRRYQEQGACVIERRWRGTAGEIDLILLLRDTVLFVEVKTSSTTERALRALPAPQLARIMQTADEYLGRSQRGLDTPARFDLAVVSSNGSVNIVENITV